MDSVSTTRHGVRTMGTVVEHELRNRSTSGKIHLSMVNIHSSTVNIHSSMAKIHLIMVNIHSIMVNILAQQQHAR
eukprot:7603258-Pyramimonas_sp.AAC.1